MHNLTMKKSTSGTWFEDMKPWVFFLILFIYQVLFTFQGLDLSDEGFNCIFFKEIYRNPDTVQYSFMFWLAGVVGGAFNWLFPDGGLWGFRLLGAMVTTGTVIVTYNLLKNYIKPVYLKLGIILSLIIISNNIKIFHYNYLCTLLFMAEASLLFNGLKSGRVYKIFLAGAVVALEVFTRIPSLVDLGLVIAVFYYGFLYKVKFATQLKQAFAFFAGFAFSVAAVVGIMKLTGQYDIFVNALNLVVEMGKGGAESHYGTMKLISQFFLLYLSSFKHSGVILVAVLIALIIGRFLRSKPYFRKWFIDALTALIIIIFVSLVVADIINHITVVFFLTDLAIIAGVFILLTGSNKDIRVLMLIGCYIMMTYPLGSSAGIYTVGVYCLWIALPITVQWLFTLNSPGNRLKLFGWEEKLGINSLLTEVQMHRLARIIFGLSIFACLFHAYYYPFFDTSDRVKMRYGIHNKYMKGIYTTEGRATSINELLEQSAKYVKPGDRVLAYHSIPMFHYMTETKPYLRNSMPWLYEGGFFSNELIQTAKNTGYLPVIIAQLKKTVGDASNWPDPPIHFDEGWAKVNEKRDQALKQFVDGNGYREVWRNEVFSILVPPGR